jgi:glycosyltransferase involved in cell wall biosynthesis
VSVVEKPDVTVVIPARDECLGVAGVITALRTALTDDQRVGEFEIVVIDDGSSDGTGQVAAAAGARVVRHERTRGYGAALKRGLRETSHEVVVIVDADATYPVAEVPEMIAALSQGAELVIGARIVRGARIFWLRRMVKKGITGFAGMLTGEPIVDLNSGLRVFLRSHLQPFLRLMPDGFSFSTSLTILSLLEGWDVRWHPVPILQRSGRSKFRPIRDTARLLLSLIRAVVYFHPMRVFLPISVGLGVGGAGCFLWDVFWEHNLTDKTVLLSITCLEVFVLGLLADLVVRKL